jgi:hypothetical protein
MTADEIKEIIAEVGTVAAGLMFLWWIFFHKGD